MTINCHCQRPSAAYEVIFSGDVVYATVTHDPGAVSQWIHDVSSLYGHGLIVGLDIEWRPNHSRDQQNPAATLQLCVGRCCLIYQLIHSPYFPLRLIQFLFYSDHNFVGLGVKSDLKKLQRDHRIGYNARTVDLRGLAAEVCEIKELKSAGLKSMARIVLGKEMEKPKSVTRSRWDNRRLTADQVRYACIDAFIIQIWGAQSEVDMWRSHQINQVIDKPKSAQDSLQTPINRGVENTIKIHPRRGKHIEGEHIKEGKDIEGLLEESTFKKESEILSTPSRRIQAIFNAFLAFFIQIRGRNDVRSKIKVRDPWKDVIKQSSSRSRRTAISSSTNSNQL